MDFCQRVLGLNSAQDNHYLSEDSEYLYPLVYLLHSPVRILIFIGGDWEEAVIDETIAFGIQDTEECNKFLQDAIESKSTFISLDSETTGLYPRDGHMLGISLCYDGHRAAYITTDCFDERSEELLQTLLRKKRVVFHNAKFDMAFFQYHFNLEFERVEDTMLLHLSFGFSLIFLNLS